MLDLIQFKSHPLIPGGHFQTILGYYLPGPNQLPGTKIHHVQVSDGDTVAACENSPAAKSNSTAMVLFMHGLGGHAESPYMLRLAKLFLEQGWRTFRLNHRGCGEGVGLAKQLYHSGRSDDISHVLLHLEKLFPELPLITVGFSLSGNALLKLLGEHTHPFPGNLAGAIAVNPPINLSACAEALSRKRNRVYDFRFVRLLKEAIRERRSHFPDFPEIHLPWNLSVRQFDEICTAPLNNFKSAEDYYAKCSARQFLPGISVPAFIIASDDDPFVPVESFDAFPENDNIKKLITKSGGHMGFVSADKTPLDNHRWMDYAIWTSAVKLAGQSIFDHH